MNFTLTKKRTPDTDLIGPDGQAIYHVETSRQLFGADNTRVQRVTSDGYQTIGAIEWPSFAGTESIVVNGQRLIPRAGGIFSKSQTFKASDGVEYKWKITGKSQTNVLVPKDHSSGQFSIASFQPASTGFLSPNRPASMWVGTQAVHIMDDVVTTAVWFQEKRYEREHRSSGGGGGC